MGLFSFICKKCDTSVIRHTGKDTCWKGFGTMIMPDGEIFEGVYDGYGRLGGEEIPLVFGPVHQPKWDDYLFQGSGYHTACYLTMEPPPTYDGPSEPAEDQGPFYDKDVDHIEPEPKV